MTTSQNGPYAIFFEAAGVTRPPKTTFMTALNSFASPCYRVAELLFPLLPVSAGGAGQAPNLTGPFGEVIANDIVPPKAAQPA